MSIFSWFTKKPALQAESNSESQATRDAPGLQRHNGRPQASTAPMRDASAANRKNEHRELLYKVVHDSMIRAGLLAASYKFKVLSLDSRGLQFMIMMDLVNQSAGDAHRQAEIEAMMAQVAKARHGILITAVYWRVSELVTTALAAGKPTAAQVLKPNNAKTLTAPAETESSTSKAPAYEPLLQDEVDAFKLALANASGSKPTAAPGRIVTSGRRNPAPVADFEDTQIVPEDERSSPLSVTQYGDLN